MPTPDLRSPWAKKIDEDIRNSKPFDLRKAVFIPDVKPDWTKTISDVMDNRKRAGVSYAAEELSRTMHDSAKKSNR